MLSLFVLTPALAAQPMLGLEWQPLGRADLSWVDDQRTSGLAVGEYDGVVAPNLEAFGGAWVGSRFGVVGKLGVARLTNTTWTDEVYRQRHWGVIRPGVDLRWSFSERVAHRPLGWLLVGAHATIPSARDVSNGYTEEEQSVADETAYTERARLGGFGGSAGLGAEIDLVPGLALGSQYVLRYHKGVFQGDDSTAASSWLAGEASLLLTWRWDTIIPPAPED